jgi:hypothetical protein
MKKEYIIGGLALLGAIGVIAYLNKPKRNSEGFFNASGRTGGCRICEGGFANYFAPNGNCRRGDRCLQSIKEFSME